MPDNINTATGGAATPGSGERLFTQEQVNAIVQDRLAKERAKYAKDISTETIETSEVDKIKADFEALRQKVEAEKLAAIDAKEKADVEATRQKRFADVSGTAKWINDFTRNGVYGEFAAAIASPEYKGKTDKEIYTALTTDKWYFQNPNPPANGTGIAPLPRDRYDPIREGMGLNRKE